MEYYFDDGAAEVAVNVTDLYDAELQNALAELGEAFAWTGVECETLVEETGGVSQWMFLLGATIKERV